jgi:hypothetical protein
LDEGYKGVREKEELNSVWRVVKRVGRREGEDVLSLQGAAFVHELSQENPRCYAVKHALMWTAKRFT